MMHDWLIIVLLDRSLRLIQTRLVNHRSPIYQTSEQFSLCIRHGGEEGVTCHVIAFDTKSDQGNTSEQYSTVLILHTNMLQLVGRLELLAALSMLPGESRSGSVRSVSS